MKEVVYAEPDNKEARELCADALEQMGYQAESATWRNAFLYGAQELRHGVFQMPVRPGMGADTLAGLTSDVFFDLMAIRLDAAKAAGQSLVVNWSFTDRNETLVLTLKHSTLTHRMGEVAADDDARHDGPDRHAQAHHSRRARRRCLEARGRNPEARCAVCDDGSAGRNHVRDSNAWRRSLTRNA
jgi:alkyl sulfatase BDS1-like metallo-beta-lactamase superfamily hydrolase